MAAYASLLYGMRNGCLSGQVVDISRVAADKVRRSTAFNDAGAYLGAAIVTRSAAGSLVTMGGADFVFPLPHVLSKGEGSTVRGRVVLANAQIEQKPVLRARYQKTDQLEWRGGDPSCIGTCSTAGETKYLC